MLVVDDHVDERQITKILLEHFGYEVSTAGSAEEALSLAQDGQPDLIVMDILMPDMDGLEAIERLAADPETAAIPVLAYTAYRDVYGDRLHSRACCDTLEKPADPEELRAAVQRRIGGPKRGWEEGRDA